MSLIDWGFTAEMELFRQEQGLTGLETGRVIAEHRERYVLVTEQGELDAEVSGHLRFTASKREDFPAVGDWVALSVYEGGTAMIHRLYPRFSAIKRLAAGRNGDLQVVSANIDFAFIVQAVDRDFNINRLERYLTLCHTAKVEPVVILSKIDLAVDTQLESISKQLNQRHQQLKLLFISNTSGLGLDALKSMILPGRTYCLLGSSGVGKSSLLNNLLEKEVMQTKTISAQTGKGRHTTSHRELFFLENGGLLIDNPGMREVGITDESDGLENTFDQLHTLAKLCRFQDCSHQSEAGCAVLDALNNGTLDEAAYLNFLKLEKERQFYETTVSERRKKEKVFGKILKDYHKKDIRNKR
jgi:ribosome biogenesis GTPase / thiamine phosphate phosphatase